MYCKNCGSQIDDGVAFCNRCGTSTSVTRKENQTNVLSVVGMIVALISLLLNFWGIVGIAAVVLSYLGLVQINKTGEKGKGMALTGIAIGAFSIVYAFVMILSLI